jgi:glycosyltransferase involved in cell wall biosynthesis
MRAAALIHATAEEEAANLRRLGLRQPIAVIPNAVELPTADELSADSSRSKSTRTALFLSRVHPKKGLLNLIKAWHSLRPTNWELIIAGPEERGHRHEIERTIQRFGLEASIRFTGPAYGRDKAELFKRADLFILPTFSENFGIVIAEALSWGLPVITTKGTPWRMLEREGCGWWIDIGAESLGEALHQATALSDGERQAMGVRGRALVQREYTWPRIAQQMLTVYRWMIRGGPQPDCVRLD